MINNPFLKNELKELLSSEPKGNDELLEILTQQHIPEDLRYEEPKIDKTESIAEVAGKTIFAGVLATPILCGIAMAVPGIIATWPLTPIMVTVGIGCWVQDKIEHRKKQ